MIETQEFVVPKSIPMTGPSERIRLGWMRKDDKQLTIDFCVHISRNGRTGQGLRVVGKKKCQRWGKRLGAGERTENAPVLEDAKQN